MRWGRVLFLLFTLLSWYARGVDLCSGYNYKLSRAARHAAIRAYKDQEYGPGKRPVSTSEGNLAMDYEARIRPFIEQKGVVGEFTGAGGLQIRYAKFEHPHEKGAVVISHGFSEAMAYYPELIFNLYERGYSIYFLDHRGHGQSGRLTSNPIPVHVDRFQNYVDDLKTFIDTQVKTKPHSKTILLGQSMGGLISTLYLKQNPGAVDKLVLSAPLFAPNLRGLPQFVAAGVAQLARTLGLGNWYALGQSERTILRDGFEDNMLTSSRARFNRKFRVWLRQPDQERNNGATFGWVAEALRACKQGRCAGPDITVPTLILKAGRDRAVLGNPIDYFANQNPNSRLAVFPDARHDLLDERDEIRDQVMLRLFQFMEEPDREPTICR